MAPDVKKYTTGCFSRAFYFDVGGVLIEDKFGKDARMMLRDLAERYGGDPRIAYTTYVELQPSLDDGRATLGDFCNAAQFDQQTLATNFCKQLLELLIFHNPALAGLSLCCSSEVGFVKPSEEFFRRAAEIMPATEVIFVDDRAANILAARKFGWTAILTSTGWLDRFKRMYFEHG